MNDVNTHGKSSHASASIKKREPIFTKMYNRFIRDPNISAVAKTVFMCLKSHKNPDDECVPPVGLVADELNLNRDTIYEKLKELESYGLLTRMRRTERGQKVANQYLFNDVHFVKHCARKSLKPCRKIPTTGIPGNSDIRKIQGKDAEDAKVIPMPKTA